MNIEHRTSCADGQVFGLTGKHRAYMRIIEQHKIIAELKDWISKMTAADRYDFEMFQKRDKDDEELDAIATARLETMQKKYVVRKTKQDIDALFKKLSSASQDKQE